MGKENKIWKFLTIWYIAVFSAILLSSGCSPDRVNPPVILCEDALDASVKSQILAIELNGKYSNGIPKGWYTVTGSGSMEPTLHGGDFIVIDKSIQLSSSQLGHILTYFPDWKPVRENTVHRMVAWDKSGAIMEGDAEVAHTENRNRVNKGNYDGEVVKIYRAK